MHDIIYPVFVVFSHVLVGSSMKRKDDSSFDLHCKYSNTAITSLHQAKYLMFY